MDETATGPTDDEREEAIARLLDARREDCFCQPYRKPCSTCDAYWDGLLDMNEATKNGRGGDDG